MVFWFLACLPESGQETPQNPSMALGFSELLNMCLPVAVYWIASGIYHLLHSSKENSRLFTKEEEDTENLATKRQVLVGVLVNQALQLALAATMIMTKGGEEGPAADAPPTSLLQLAGQLAVATLIMDAWGYFWHRLTHESKFLMKHVHGMHHHLIVPYAYGAQYVHPVDSLFGELAPAIMAGSLSGMSPRTGAVYFSVLTLKTVDDHCGLWFPNGNPIHRFFKNSAAFHTVHHQRRGFKHNYSAHFFHTWDLLFGTYLPFAVEKREDGRYHIHSAKDD